MAPRYIPGVPLPGPSVGDGMAPDTDAVPDASRITPPVLLPGFPNPVRLSLAVDVLPSALAPSRLPLQPARRRRGARKVRCGGSCCNRGERLDRDFILRFRLGRRTNSDASLCVQPDEAGDEGTFLLTLAPPDGEPGRVSTRRPRDVVFVLDRSGSMGGWKMVAARRAMARMVDTLTEHDRFTVLAFDDRIETPPGGEGWSLVAATDRQRFQAVEFLNRIEARGGTEMAQPLDAGHGGAAARRTRRAAATASWCW